MKSKDKYCIYRSYDCRCVGWVAGYSFEQANGDVRDVSYSLDAMDALRMDERTCTKISDWLDKHGGGYHIFEW